MRPLLRIGLCVTLVFNSAGIPALAGPPAKVAKPNNLGAPHIAALELKVGAICPGKWDLDPCKSADYNIEDFKEKCVEWTASCRKVGPLFSDALDIGTAVAHCAATPCRRSILYDLAREQQLLSVRIDSMPAGPAPADVMPNLWTWSFANEIDATLTRVVMKAVDADLEEIGTALDRLEAKTKGFEGAVASGASPEGDRVHSLGVEGQELFERFQGLSRGIDHAMSSARDTQKEPLKERRRSANKIARRLGGMRDRLILLQRSTRQDTSARLDLSEVYDPSVEEGEAAKMPKKRPETRKIDLEGLGKAFDDRSGGARMGASGAGSAVAGRAPVSGGVGAGSHPLINAEPKKTLLDVPGAVAELPNLPTEPIAPPPIEKKGPEGFWDTASRLSGRQGERKAIDAMRRLGMTRTVGRPGNYAPLVHEQEGDTCAVVTQQQVLTAYGLVKGDKPKEMEVSLRDEAVSKGYFQHGTSPQYSGSLLVDHGMIIAKREDTKAADLDKVLLTGKPAIVGVDARHLWGMEDYDRPLGHSILVTGVEVSKVSGQILGYYYNDSGSAPPKGGGFITAEKFRESFESRGGKFIEIQ